MRGYAASPCLRCIKVADPRNCENKNCKTWQAWFLGRWELIRQYPRQEMDRTPLKPAGVAIGGSRYCHPAQVKTYLTKDPCESCRCPKDLCTTPCRIRRTWEEARGDVLL